MKRPLLRGRLGSGNQQGKISCPETNTNTRLLLSRAGAIEGEKGVHRNPLELEQIESVQGSIHDAEKQKMKHQS